MNDPWRFPFPNAADFNFNYHHLLSHTPDGIGRVRNPELRVAIVGAGAAGLTVARELFRAGVKHLHIFEASDRIGGRLWSQPVPGQAHTTYELGAMRIPTFAPSEIVDNHTVRDRSAFGYYQGEFGIGGVPFPNPGSIAGGCTGIFLKDGRGPTGDADPSLLLWRPTPDDKAPPTDPLRRVYEKWFGFAERFQAGCRDAYEAGDAAWRARWHQIVLCYWHLDFADLVHLPGKSGADGDFGGLGMDEDEARLLYVMGVGDGGWGAFFNVSCLYVLRVMLFGFGDGHQLIEGVLDNPPDAGRELYSSNHHRLERPHFRGVQSLAECLLYAPCRGEASLFSAMNEPDGPRLYTRAAVRRISRQNDGSIALRAEGSPPGEYDAVVLTCPGWSLQLNVEFDGFGPDLIPDEVTHSMATSHWITSCKVFLPLREKIDPATQRPDDQVIPPLLMTDRFIQGVYSYGVRDDPGVLLVSYTWEDDATKLLSIADDHVLARRCVDELDRVLKTTGRRGLSRFLDIDHVGDACVIRWSRQPSYAGCSKLYRERMWNENQALLHYNQDVASQSGLFFAGDAFTVESGWVEAALRSALDATINLLVHHGAEMAFDVHKYPRRQRWDVEAEAHAAAGAAAKPVSGEGA